MVRTDHSACLTLQTRNNRTNYTVPQSRVHFHDMKASSRAMARSSLGCTVQAEWRTLRKVVRTCHMFTFNI